MIPSISTWMVRAGEGGRQFEIFRERNIVGLGWALAGDTTSLISRDDFVQRVKHAYPHKRDQANFVGANTLFRFVRIVKKGDRVATYDPGARSYLCGTLTSDCWYEPNEQIEELQNLRSVQWSHECKRDELSIEARNSLGATLTLFAISQAHSRELWRESTARMQHPAETETPSPDAPVSMTGATDKQIADAASEAIKDRIAALDWAEMQELVAGLLRSMGYKTIVSPPGADRGKDIVASPDGFGFQEPRIIVEVKHRVRERISSPAIRSFLGGRHANDKGLFVSTGGFTSDAYYEAERANIPLTLLDFEGLIAAILENYPRLDEVSRQLLPLKTIYWPIER